MNKTQRYITIGIILLMIALLGSQYMAYQKQITRHENAIKFWKEEVPKMQEQYPEFKPQNTEEKLVEENKLFETQKKTIYTQSGLIIILGIVGILAVYYIPKKRSKK